MAKKSKIGAVEVIGGLAIVGLIGYFVHDRFFKGGGSKGEGTGTATAGLGEPTATATVTG